MRLRKLGKGQSVVFCIPGEIQTRIRSIVEKQDADAIDVSDVLVWAIHETYADLRKSMPLWATQGARFERQFKIWAEHARIDTGITMTAPDAQRFLEKEALDLEDRYKPRDASALPDIFDELKSSAQLQKIYERCERFDSIRFASAILQEEQERELSPEIEAERQIERPMDASPMPHKLHPDVVSFVKSGKIVHNSPAFMKAFQAFTGTSAAAHLNVARFPCDLLATRDFVQTVEVIGKEAYTDDYQRPVQWLLTQGNPATQMVVISPFEANELKSTMKSSSAAVLHLYAPRSNLAYQPLDSLRLYTVPSLPTNWKVSVDLVMQLNLFAGQLYFRSFDEYKQVCEFLCLAWQKMDDDVPVQADGFIIPQPGGQQAFDQSPTKFLQVVTTKMRRNGQGIDKTHLGKMLAGELLGEADFENTQSAALGPG